MKKVNIDWKNGTRTKRSVAYVLDIDKNNEEFNGKFMTDLPVVSRINDEAPNFFIVGVNNTDEEFITAASADVISDTSLCVDYDRIIMTANDDFIAWLKEGKANEAAVRIFKIRDEVECAIVDILLMMDVVTAEEYENTMKKYSSDIIPEERVAPITFTE